MALYIFPSLWETHIQKHSVNSTCCMVVFCGYSTCLCLQAPFATPQDSLLKTLIMMSGEYNYEDIFLNDGPVPFQFTTYTGPSSTLPNFQFKKMQCFFKMKLIKMVMKRLSSKLFSEICKNFKIFIGYQFNGKYYTP